MKLVRFLLTLPSCVVMSVLAQGNFSLQEAEEGQPITFEWVWPVNDSIGSNGIFNAGCTLTGLPGVSPTHRGTPDSSVHKHSFTAGKTKVDARISCSNIVPVGGGRFQVNGQYDKTFTMLLKPTMDLSYPDDVTVTPGNQKGVYTNTHYRFKFSAKNAERCELQVDADSAWGSIDTSYTTKLAFGSVPPDGYAVISTRCSNLSGTFQKSLRVLVVNDPTPKPSDVTINSFTHGNYEYDKTTLGWSTANAKSCNVKRSDGVESKNVGTFGVHTLKVDVGFTYTLDCVGVNGSKASKSLLVAHINTQPVVIKSFSAEAYHSGEAALRWSTSYAKSCSIKGSNGFDKPDAGISGIATLRVPTGQNYTLNCVGYGDSRASQVLFVAASACVDCNKVAVSISSSEINVESEVAINQERQIPILILERDGELYKVLKKYESQYDVYKMNNSNGMFEFEYTIVNPMYRTGDVNFIAGEGR